DDKDQVSRVTTQPATSGANSLVSAERAARVKEGISRGQVHLELGTPATVREKAAWYVGPAAYGCFELAEGKLARAIKVEASENHTEKDIAWQKWIAAFLSIASLIVASKFLGAVRTRALLDDTGLTYNGKQIPWDNMTALNIAEYRDKGWVDLA